MQGMYVIEMGWDERKKWPRPRGMSRVIGVRLESRVVKSVPFSTSFSSTNSTCDLCTKNGTTPSHDHSSHKQEKKSSIMHCITVVTFCFCVLGCLVLYVSGSRMVSYAWNLECVVVAASAFTSRYHSHHMRYHFCFRHRAVVSYDQASTLINETCSTATNPFLLSNVTMEQATRPHTTVKMM